MKKLFYAINVFEKYAQTVEISQTNVLKPNDISQTNIQKKPVKAPNYTATIKGNVEYRDRFHGAEGEERQKLLEEEAKKKGFTLVPTKKTPVTESQVIQAVKNIINNKYPQMDDAAKQELVFTLVPQIKVETGYQPMNYNMGNAHANTGWKGKVSVWDDPQKTKSNQKYINKSWFWRAFDTLDEGVASWFALFETRFPAALEKAKIGDIAGFSKALSAGGYYSEPEANYTKALIGTKNNMKKKYYKDTSQAIK